MPRWRREYISEISVFEAGQQYYVETDCNKPVREKKSIKFTTMEEFYVKLKTEQGLSIRLFLFSLQLDIELFHRGELDNFLFLDGLVEICFHVVLMTRF
jgi:hypothetical protein